MPWQLKYVGAQETGNKLTLMRNQVTVGCSENVTSFLTELGFRANTEFLNKGDLDIYSIVYWCSTVLS